MNDPDTLRCGADLNCNFVTNKHICVDIIHTKFKNTTGLAKDFWEATNQTALESQWTVRMARVKNSSWCVSVQEAYEYSMQDGPDAFEGKGCDCAFYTCLGTDTCDFLQYNMSTEPAPYNDPYTQNCFAECCADMAKKCEKENSNALTGMPTAKPTVKSNPTSKPTPQISGSPTSYPTDSPTPYPTGSPTKFPTADPTETPTEFPTVSPTQTLYTQKYEAAWPYCTDIQCGTFTLAQAKAFCDARPTCTGFSYTKGNPATGSGCYKECGTSENFAGYGFKTHGYWAKGPVVDAMKVKYTSQYPHCTNIRCGSFTLSDFKHMCESDASCSGFSWPEGNPEDGRGCLKKCGSDEASAGYGTGTYGYWVKTV
eukprot:CAMPEP_0167821690 /NCGR_PEP_ID=MMETSP0112_2-20121227/6969_1 /TAXON_ID=91324 /ORGANISM="Lotharella globosa, Strain CCCM811" /LENGTH=368 /DNA_ID=CAMNT_0007722751 /DNA_START=29 /DNA_END=1135 /DNA_ORIENTATION=-